MHLYCSKVQNRGCIRRAELHFGFLFRGHILHLHVVRFFAEPCDKMIATYLFDSVRKNNHRNAIGIAGGITCREFLLQILFMLQKRPLL